MPIAFWLGYLYEQSLMTEAALDFVHEDIEELASRVSALEHNMDLKVVRMIVPQGTA